VIIVHAMDPLGVERDQGVVTVTVSNPGRKNAVTSAMVQALLAVFVQVAADPDDRVLVITGAGEDFCSGADVQALSDRPTVHPLVGMRGTGNAALALHRIPKPTIAKVNGVAAGLGCNLALSCDLIVASDTARFSEIFSRRGLSLDFGGSWLLPRLVGLHRAKELALFGDVVSAQEAAAIGLVNRVVQRAELDAFVEDWARRLAAGPPLALSMTKTMLNNAFAVSMEQAVEDEARSQAVNFASADPVEGFAAFMAKREPRFTGH
jgi:enoyl-CoA hydratase/carnithine racemase